MKFHPGLIWERVRASYWFWPAVMVIGTFVLLQITLQLDTSEAFKKWTDKSWLQFGSPAGARDILSTISGALITLIATVFTLTMVVMTIAGSHYGILLLRNFMKDRKTQHTLGVFIATFVYCIITLRSIQERNETVYFLPHISVNVALLLTLVSMVYLVSFIHHIATRIQAPTVISLLFDELVVSIGQYYPTRLNEGEVQVFGGEDEWDDGNGGVEVLAKKDGYVQAIDVAKLVRVGAEHDCCLRLKVKVGDFVVVGELLGYLQGEGVEEDVKDAVRGQIAVGRYRTTQQDVRYAVDQLVELGQRALSPGINEELMGIICVNYLSAGMVKVGTSELAVGQFRDEDNVLRVVRACVSFEVLFERSFGTLLADADGHAMVTRTLLDQAKVLREQLVRKEDVEVVERFIGRVEMGV